MQDDFTWDPILFHSELGKRLAVSPSQNATQIREAVKEIWNRYPNEHKVGLLGRLKGADSHFRGALWEMFWFNLCARWGLQDPIVEWSQKVGNGKTVDFYLPNFTGGIAIEVSSLNEYNAEVLKEFFMSDLMEACREKILAPHHYIHIQIAKWTTRLPDISRVVEGIQDWALEDLWVTDPNLAQQGRLRLTYEDDGWILTVEAVPTKAHWGEPWISRIGEARQIDLGQRIEERLREKVEKANSLTNIPFVLAIAETGGLVGNARWHRVNALYGNDLIHIWDNGTHTSGRGENGFFFGPTGWCNPQVSAVAFTGDWLPDFENGAIEWWLNEGAQLKLDATLLAQSGDVITIKDGVLQILRQGTQNWETAHPD